MIPDGQVYHYDWSKGNRKRKSTLAEYMRQETSTPEITHTNQSPQGKTIRDALS